MRISYWSSDVCSSDLLKLNRRTAPNLYKTVHPITRDQDGSFAIDGDGEAVDWVLGMERFPDGALWSELADRNALDVEALQKMADALVDFNSREQIAWPGAGAVRIGKLIAGNAEAMGLYPAVLDPMAVEELDLKSSVWGHRGAVRVDH